MNLICNFFGHRYDKKETTVRVLDSGLFEVKTICPRCNKITYALVVPEKADGDKQGYTTSTKKTK